MELKLLESKEIDKSKWDVLIWNSKEGNVYALFDYLSSCERQWKAMLALDGEKYLAAIPLQYQSRFWLKSIYQDPFVHELGLYSRGILEAEHLEKMLHKAFDHYKLVSAYCFNVDNTPFIQRQKALKRENLFLKKTYCLDLKKPIEEIEIFYSNNRKRDLKKALRFEQTIYSSSDLEPFMGLFKTFTAPKIKGIQDYQFSLLRQNLLQQLKNKLGELYYVQHKGELISAAFISRFKNKIVYLYGANSEKAIHLKSSTLVLDHILRKYAGQDYVFDFEGSDDPNLARYYSSFGAQKVHFYEYRKNELPSLIKAARQFRQSVIRSFIS